MRTVSLSEIEARLRSLGLTRRYKGFARLTYAISLVLENESRLEAVVKEVYIPVAELFGCTWYAVERSVRTACSYIWIEHADKIHEITGIRLRHPPTPAELLDIFAVYIKYQTD